MSSRGDTVLRLAGTFAALRVEAATDGMGGPPGPEYVLRHAWEELEAAVAELDRQRERDDFELRPRRLNPEIVVSNVKVKEDGR